MKLYLFRVVHLSIIRSSFTVHSAMVYVYRFVDSCRAGPGWKCSKAVYKPVWRVPFLSVQWINSWWWTEELSEICRVSCQNKFLKLVHLVGFIIKKFVTMHGHMNVKLLPCLDGWMIIINHSSLERADQSTNRMIQHFNIIRLSLDTQYCLFCCWVDIKKCGRNYFSPLKPKIHPNYT